MVKKLKSSGVKIDGVGVQAHWDLASPSLDQIEQIILDVHAAGVPVSFTGSIFLFCRIHGKWLVLR